MRTTTRSVSTVVIPLILTLAAAQATAHGESNQGGRGAAPSSSRHIIYGDVKVQQGQGGTEKPISLDLTLYTEYGNPVARQRVQSNGRYRFIDLQDGRYYVLIEYEGSELDRFTVDFSSQYKSDLQRDIELQANVVSAAAKAAVISAAEKYDRGSKTSSTFSKAKDALKNKQYDEAVTLLRRVVEIDPADFPAWRELGTTYFIQKNYAEAEKAYLQALAKHPDYVIALISLGRLRIVEKNFDGAIEVLSQAIKLEPTSAQANYFLGEAYLQNKKGSLAVGYLNEAIKLDPVGMADAHLRLATLYNAVGMKDKAANEYEQFLKKVPDYPDKKKLEEYVTANKKP
ncbi:MAG TPA: tetratricopeptide repeat protein [Pyrinomonadaceae bacterium]|jgi:Putative Zn-dependent protease, contains TPR repeats|nr:tetratricopeptide repeat protein [Pyrinomonadaceae bacterium]